MRIVQSTLQVLAILLLAGCVTRSEIKAALWLNNGMDAGLCAREPALRNYGFYRRLNDGKLEFISYCNPVAREFFAIHKKDLEELLNATLPEQE